MDKETKKRLTEASPELRGQIYREAQAVFKAEPGRLDAKAIIEVLEGMLKTDPGSVVLPVGDKVVTVRANEHLAELIDGRMLRFTPGETFPLPAARAQALGKLVTLVSPAKGG